jgi:hypothetical protein
MKLLLSDVERLKGRRWGMEAGGESTSEDEDED